MVDLRASRDETKRKEEERPEEADRVTGYPTKELLVGSRAAAWELRVRCGGSLEVEAEAYAQWR